MAISGLVLTLSDDDAADSALAVLSLDPRLTLGERFGQKLAVVAETPGVESDRQLWDDLSRTPGIIHVDITYVHLDQAPITSGAGPSPSEKSHADR